MIPKVYLMSSERPHSSAAGAFARQDLGWCDLLKSCANHSSCFPSFRSCINSYTFRRIEMQMTRPFSFFFADNEA